MYVCPFSKLTFITCEVIKIFGLIKFVEIIYRSIDIFLCVYTWIATVAFDRSQSPARTEELPQAFNFDLNPARLFCADITRLHLLPRYLLLIDPPSPCLAEEGKIDGGRRRPYAIYHGCGRGRGHGHEHGLWAWACVCECINV